MKEKTTGTPIGLLIKNEDQKTKDYSKIKDLYRPSHADYTYEKKYGIRDYRGGGRSSARETTMRVAAGAIAKKVLRDTLGVSVYGFVSQIGDIRYSKFDRKVINQNSFLPLMRNLFLNWRISLRNCERREIQSELR